MSQRLLSLLGIGLIASLTLNLVLAVLVLGGRPAPQAFGQGVMGGGGFILSTVQGSDQSPTCFVLRTERPHLMVYKTDSAGQLQLTSSRDIGSDMLLPDHYFPRGQVVRGQQTKPPVSAVRRATSSLTEPKTDEEKK